MTHRHRRPWFLNPAVKAAVAADPVLKGMWVATRQPYDDEIEPLHNDAWVKQAQVREQAHLQDLQAKLPWVERLCF
jgi:hypothetical protein